MRACFLFSFSGAELYPFQFLGSTFRVSSRHDPLSNLFVTKRTDSDRAAVMLPATAARRQPENAQTIPPGHT